jgi:SAM-dependent methyltransferase
MQALPIADKSVDVVLSTLMLHHVPRPAWPEAMREMRRVLKPDGRMLIVDFIKPDADQRGFMHHIHRHGFMRLDRVVAALEAAGFAIKATGEVGQNDLNFVLATPNGETVMTSAEQFSISTEEDHTNSHGHRHGHGLLVGVGLLLAALLIGLHLGAAAYLPQLFSSRMSTIFIVLVAAIIILKLGFLTLLHRAAGGFLERWLGARKSED